MSYFWILNKIRRKKLNVTKKIVLSAFSNFLNKKKATTKIKISRYTRHIKGKQEKNMLGLQHVKKNQIILTLQMRQNTIFAGTKIVFSNMIPIHQHYKKKFTTMKISKFYALCRIEIIITTSITISSSSCRGHFFFCGI